MGADLGVGCRAMKIQEAVAFVVYNPCEDANSTTHFSCSLNKKIKVRLKQISPMITC
jgi:hypothetical protein